jgi:hypothetical protein
MIGTVLARSFAVAGLVLLIRCSNADGAVADFPAAQEVCAPDQNWCVVGTTAEGGDELHTLLLENAATGSRRLLLRYGRHVRVLWAPDSSGLAVTDAEGSDSSRTYLIDIRSLERIDVGKQLITGDPTLGPLLRNHHAYLDATRFIRSHTLLLSAHGYGDESPNGFQRCYALDTVTLAAAPRLCP